MEIYRTAYPNELMHHGIEGQKWGKRNGPPYPLDYSDHSAAEKKHLSRSEKKERKVNAKENHRIENSYKAKKLYQEISDADLRIETALENHEDPEVIKSARKQLDDAEKKYSEYLKEQGWNSNYDRKVAAKLEKSTARRQKMCDKGIQEGIRCLDKMCQDPKLGKNPWLASTVVFADEWIDPSDMDNTVASYTKSMIKHFAQVEETLGKQMSECNKKANESAISKVNELSGTKFKDFQDMLHNGSSKQLNAYIEEGKKYAETNPEMLSIAKKYVEAQQKALAKAETDAREYIKTYFGSNADHEINGTVKIINKTGEVKKQTLQDVLGYTMASSAMEIAKEYRQQGKEFR